MVFVLDKRKRPLMPCTEKRARLLLERGRAVVHKRFPFTIRLKDRLVEESRLQPLRLKLDPGARVTGVAVLRERGSVARRKRPSFGVAVPFTTAGLSGEEGMSFTHAVCNQAQRVNFGQSDDRATLIQS